MAPNRSIAAADDGRGGVGVRQISDHREGGVLPLAELGKRALERGLLSTDRDHRCAALGKRDRSRAADSARRTSDDGDLAGKRHGASIGGQAVLWR